MPTEDICQNFNELRSDLVLLYELKLGLSTCEYELQALRHQYEALAPGKTLEIPPSLLSNNDSTVPAEDISVRPKTLSEVIDVVGSAATPMQSSSNSKSGVLLSENVFSRNSVISPEKSIASCHLQHQPVVHQQNPSLNNRPSLVMDLPVQHSEKSISQFKWQQELLMMRNTCQLDETTPVYNLSNHGIMQLFELREAQRLSIASSFMKKIEDFEELSRRCDNEDCLRKKQELQERLVPKTESQTDIEMTIQRLQDEAKLRIQQKEDQIDQKLKEMQTIQEKELQEDLKKKTLELQIVEAKRRNEISSGRLESLLKSLKESMTSCLEKDSFLKSFEMKLNRVTALKTQFQVVASSLNYGDPLSSTVRGENIVKQIEDLVEVIKEDISKNNAIVQAKNAPAQPPPEPTLRSSEVKQEQRSDPHERLQGKPIDANEGHKDVDFVHKEDLTIYSQLQAELQQYEVSAAAFSSDLSLKTLRFELQKAVLHPVNEISDQSGQHLQDKLDRLRNLLQGNAVQISSRTVRANEHPGGYEYCANLLARRLVAQGEDQVNVNPKAAFPIAAIISELWLEFPVFGRLVLAHFYRQCPYIVPYYLPQKEGQSNEDYYKSLGYRYSGGKVEQQPAYLKRMSGVVRLYAAILISVPRRNQPHPHGLEHAWRYLAALLNLPPRNDITATILVEFLTVTGAAMSREYGRQFQKMLHLICTDYFTMIRNVTPKGSGGGPVTRLEEFLHESITKGGIPPPAGQLPPRFW
uniref:mRNA export factor GLE1 n=1 Tax=Daphnia barbata TaxID=414587 RepID=A0A4Y7M0Z7_9CRUS|nr:EOG090X0755 [Daphnia barbata]